MAPKKRKDSEDDVFGLEGEHKEEKLALGDTNSLKRALDDAVAEVMSDARHHIDNTYTDLKIGLGVAACCVALLAQFWPKKDPNNFWVAVACVAAYVVFSTLMSVVAMVYEKDTIVVTRGGGPSGHPALVVTSKLPRFEDKYTLRIAPRGAPGAASSSGGSTGGAVCLSKGVGAYFHEDGYLAADRFKRDVNQLLAQLDEAKSK